MNDYLSNLAARSFDQAEGIPLVSPRMPSLFEPLQSAPDVFAPVESWPSKDGESGDGMEARFSTKSVERSEQEDQVQEITYHAHRTSEAESRESALRAQRSEVGDPGVYGRDTVDEEQAVEIPSQKEPINALKIARPLIFPVPTVHEPDVRFAEQEGPDATRTRDGGEQDGRIRPAQIIKPVSMNAGREEGLVRSLNGLYEDQHRVGKLLPMEEGREIAGQAGSPEAAAQRRHKVIAPVITPVSLRSSEPMHRAWTATNAGEENTKPAPTIQVTIGRIEVRASPPAARSRARSKEPEPMSLDQYLRGRNGGRR